ncbi:hypothetical protein DMENIID0001_002670 [Sergentomyia squamirostris]
MTEKNNDSKPPFDPGWNDPPKMGYEEQGKSSPSRNKLNLNRRVAFPMSGPAAGGGQKVELAPSGLPMPFARVSTNVDTSGNAPSPLPNASLAKPPPPPTANLPPASGNPSKESEATQGTVSEEEMRKTLKDFNTLSQKIEDIKVREEVLRRLDLLRVQTNKNHLSDEVKVFLVKICEALNGEKFADASLLHRKLMIDFHSECNSWGSFLRNIILAAEPLNPEEDLGEPDSL